ncbi:hypothetical protein JL722_13967 [Aureococcus anophagefferens]|nr:hypothetical protein JL722_13967 [Aureococcus anophagefferens]
MSCVVCGTTGAGKSTLLNALLGESEVLPTNGMRACTAVLIELRYLDDAASPGDGSTYVGEAEFLTRAEWDKGGGALRGAHDAGRPRDPQPTRGAVVKLALKEADSVWIVSNINRAVNDRSAKDLLGESFKRTLLMDGAYGRLVFAATQSACSSGHGPRRGGARSAAELEAQFTMPVYCVSSVDYQKLKGVRGDDGPPQVYDAASLAATEIRRVDFAHGVAVARARKVALQTRSLLAFAESLESADVLPRLDAGAADAAKTCVATASKWGGSRAEGGLHWATYKATLRRGGNWRQNFNEELAEPVYRAVATHWEKAMVDKARRGLDALDGALDAARVAAARRAHEASSSAVASSALAATKDHIQKQQKDLSREITPLVQAAMQPGYDRGFVEKGTGSHRRRCAVVESHVTKEARSMFKGAIAPVVARAARTRGSGVVAGLAKLRADVGKILKDTCARKLLDDLRLNYRCSGARGRRDARVRGAMAHPLNVATCEVRSALRRLLDSQGAAPEARAGDDDDDGDIVDITSKVAAERTVEVIDVDDLDVPDAPPAPPAAASARGGVKAERA